jgi:hypothetical protein
VTKDSPSSLKPESFLLMLDLIKGCVEWNGEISAKIRKKSLGEGRTVNALAAAAPCHTSIADGTRITGTEIVPIIARRTYSLFVSVVITTAITSSEGFHASRYCAE